MSKCLLIHHVKFLKASHIKLVRLYIIYISIIKFVNLSIPVSLEESVVRRIHE